MNWSLSFSGLFGFQGSRVYSSSSLLLGHASRERAFTCGACVREACGAYESEWWAHAFARARAISRGAKGKSSVLLILLFFLGGKLPVLRRRAPTTCTTTLMIIFVCFTRKKCGIPRARGLLLELHACGRKDGVSKGVSMEGVTTLRMTPYREAYGKHRTNLWCEFFGTFSPRFS